MANPYEQAKTSADNVTSAQTQQSAQQALYKEVDQAQGTTFKGNKTNQNDYLNALAVQLNTDQPNTHLPDLQITGIKESNGQVTLSGIAADGTTKETETIKSDGSSILTDSNGYVRQTVSADGNTTTITPDKNGNPTEIQGTGLDGKSYDYKNVNGQWQGSGGPLFGDSSPTNVAVDSSGNITATLKNGNTAFVDTNGNSYEINSKDQIVSSQGRDGSGQVVNRGFDYDQHGKLVKIEDKTNNLNWVYQGNFGIASWQQQNAANGQPTGEVASSITANNGWNGSLLSNVPDGSYTINDQHNTSDPESQQTVVVAAGRQGPQDKGYTIK